MGAGLATVRADHSERRALDDTERNPPTCAPDDSVEHAVARVQGATLVVVNEQRIVLGRLRVSMARAGGDRRVEDVMEAGPTTVRAHEQLIPLLERMARRRFDEVIVTTPEGELLGVVHLPKERS